MLRNHSSVTAKQLCNFVLRISFVLEGSFLAVIGKNRKEIRFFCCFLAVIGKKCYICS